MYMAEEADGGKSPKGADSIGSVTTPLGSNPIVLDQRLDELNAKLLKQLMGKEEDEVPIGKHNGHQGKRRRSLVGRQISKGGIAHRQKTRSLEGH